MSICTGSEGYQAAKQPSCELTVTGTSWLLARAPAAAVQPWTTCHLGPALTALTMSAAASLSSGAKHEGHDGSCRKHHCTGGDTAKWCRANHNAAQQIHPQARPQPFVRLGWSNGLRLPLCGQSRSLRRLSCVRVRYPVFERTSADSRDAYARMGLVGIGPTRGLGPTTPPCQVRNSKANDFTALITPA